MYKMVIRFDFLPVAGEAILVTTDDCTLLIDASSSHPFKGKLFKRSQFYKDNKRMPPIDVCIITHIDYDHINGAIKLLQDSKFLKNFKQIWFNEPESARIFDDGSGKVHAGHGILLKKIINKNNSIEHIHDISTFDAHNICFQKTIKNTIGSINFSLLSPSKNSLDELYRKWNPEKYKKPKTGSGKTLLEIINKNIIDCKSIDLSVVNLDKSFPNASSIAFIMNYNHMNFLLLADAHITIVCNSLKNPLHVEFAKLSLHGSIKNINIEFFNLVRTSKYVICRNSHSDLPNVETIFNICCNRKNKKDDIIIYINKDFNKGLESICKKDLEKYKVTIKKQDQLTFGE
jgi:beta-lactamase superfamily II metal-dependent hydrolase